MPPRLTNTFVIGSMVVGIPSYNPGITYKDIYPILVCKLIYLCFAYQNLRKNFEGPYPCHNSYGVISADHDDALFSVRTVVSEA